MNLQPINPPARTRCAGCHCLTYSALADIDAAAGWFYCRDCAADLLGVCPNCYQFQRRSDGGDCFKRCVARGFAKGALP